MSSSTADNLAQQSQAAAGGVELELITPAFHTKPPMLSEACDASLCVTL